MSTETQVQLVWEERNTLNLLIKDNFRFKSHFNLGQSNDVYCGRVEPPNSIRFENEPLKIIHFKAFSRIGNFLTFTLSNNDPISVELPVDKGIIKLTILEIPVPIPAPNAWNDSIGNSNDICHTHLFYYPQEGDRSLKFMKTIQCPWSGMTTQINNALTEKRLGHYGKSVGILTKEGAIPDLESVDSFFSAADSYRKAKAFMIMVVSSFEEFTLILGNLVIPTKNVPRIPKDFIHRCRLAALVERRGYDKHLRRVLKIAVNGGIPVDLLENALIQKNDGTVFISSDLDRLFIRFGAAPNLPAALERRLAEVFEDAKNHLRVSSSELALRIIFWDAIIKEMLKSGLEKHNHLPFVFVPEWNSTSLFPEFNLRKVDIAVLFGIPGRIEEYPIALFEEAKEDFDWENPHKDFTKLAAMLSSCCIKLALDMARMRRKPEEARCFGSLIGRGKIQFLIAHPVISEIEVDGQTVYEIHSNISSSSHCIYDVSSIPPAREVPEEDFCCHAPRLRVRNEYEKLVPGTIDVNEFQFLPEALKASIEDIVLLPSETEPGRAESAVDNDRLFPNGVSINVMKKLYFFIECIKERIKIIQSDSSKMNNNDRREFFDYGKFGEFGSGKPTSQRDSPEKIAAAKAFSESQLKSVKTNLRKQYKKTKSSVYEWEIVTDLSNVFPLSFPTLFDYRFEEDGQITYYFETLKPLIGPNGRISDLLVSPVAGMSLFNCFCFALQCLLALDNLHSSMEIVHSDISINNIMYSDRTGTWKLIDFDQSLTRSESLANPRTAGTKGYIAPESKATGIFSEKSDIYSLGQVFTEIIDAIFLNQIHSVESDDEDFETIQEIRSIEPVAMKFTNIINSMIRSDPTARPTALDALKAIYELFESIFNVPDQLIFDLINLRTRVIPKDRPLQEVSEKGVVNPVPSPKRIRIETEEKEPSTSIIAPQVQ